MLLFKIITPLLLVLTTPILTTPKEKALGNVTLENSGDAFHLVDTTYDATESFVYTTVANFESGQAGGLVFGAVENEHYWVFNIDRIENSTKLMYFTMNEGVPQAEVLDSDYFIGNDKITTSELNMVKPSVASNPRFHLKVVVSIEDDHAYAEFFIDNIKRFGVDNTIDLNTLISGVTYSGGQLGYNVFNSRVTYTDTTVGLSDYTYYTELYRNQYHYSQFSHWNNDPNGLVYYDGWYHMYYQTHPFSKQWSDMYWGHARSKDLLHWQELPIALFPDDGNMGVGTGKGLAWSGAAIVYRQGMSDTIDNLGWFPEGEGLMGYYTRDGDRQDQVIITSTDGGMTWVKRRHISQHLCVDGRKVDCRDPSLFPIKKDGDKVTLWGMALSGGTQNKIWFLKSSDMVEWSYAGGFNYEYPECVTMVNFGDHYAMSISSRYYAIGNIEYDETSGHVNFVLQNGVNTATYDGLTNGFFEKMDYGEDSYAAQCFYIDDPLSKYYGSNVSISWFSGLPSDAESGIYANVRDPWNGGGMTIPVILQTSGNQGERYLTQTPITLNNDDLTKTEILNIDADTVLTEARSFETTSHAFEMILDVNLMEATEVEIKINQSEDEYTSVGWNKEEGYYIDRTHTSDAGINFNKGYHRRFITGPTSSTQLSFYILSDNGGFEVFCDNFKYSFYNLSLCLPYSLEGSISSDSDITINQCKINDIATTWRDPNSLTEGYVTLLEDHVDLDLTLGDEAQITAFASNGDPLTWEVIEGNDVVSITPNKKGAVIKALKNGEATVSASAYNETKTLSVTVDDADVDCFFTPTKDNILSGQWLTTSQGLIGKQSSGDGFIIDDETLCDGTITAVFDLNKADAAGILLRANEDLSRFIMVNYDKVMGGCKIWTNERELGRLTCSVSDLSNVVLSAVIKDENLTLTVNGVHTLTVQLSGDYLLSGHTGLNVCSGQVTFKAINLLREEYDYNNIDLVFTDGVPQHINAIYNVTDNNTKVPASYYTAVDGKITLSTEYFALLEENTQYTFRIEGTLSSYTIKVNVTNINRTYEFDDISTQLGLDVCVYVGILDVNKVSVDNVEVDFAVDNYTLTIASNHFPQEGEYIVSINDTYTFKVQVNAIDVPVIDTGDTGGCKGSLIATSSLLLSATCIFSLLVILKKKRGHDYE